MGGRGSTYSNGLKIVKRVNKYALVQQDGKINWIPWNDSTRKPDVTNTYPELTKKGKQLLNEGSSVNEFKRLENLRKDGVKITEKPVKETKKSLTFDVNVEVESRLSPNQLYRKSYTKDTITIPKSSIKNGKIKTSVLEKRIGDLEFKYFESREGYVRKSANIKQIFGKKVSFDNIYKKTKIILE